MPVSFNPFTGDLQFETYDPLVLVAGDGSGTVTVQAAPAFVTSYTLKLPNADGPLGYFLFSLGGSQLEWGQLSTNLQQLNAIVRNRGDLIVGGASAWVDLGVGGAGQALFADGTDPGWRAILASDIQGLSPVWTGNHEFQGTFVVTSQNPVLQNAGAPPSIIFSNTLAGKTLSLEPGAVAANLSVYLPQITGDLASTGSGSDPPTLAQMVGKVNRATTSSPVSTGVKITNGAPAGWYEIEYYVRCTTAGSGTLNLLLTYNDGSARSDVTIGSASMGSTTIPGFGQGTFTFYLASGDTTWKTAFSSGGSGSYQLRMRATYKGP